MFRCGCQACRMRTCILPHKWPAHCTTVMHLARRPFSPLPLAGAGAGGRGVRRGGRRTVGRRGPPPRNPQKPNSRRGRKTRSSFRQGRVDMDRIIVGIDVSKDRLDVAVRPSGEAFAVSRDAAGVEQLVARLRKLSPHLVALEATGGFETVVAAALGAAGLPVVVVNPAQVRAFAKAPGQPAKTPTAHA